MGLELSKSHRIVNIWPAYGKLTENPHSQDESLFDLTQNMLCTNILDSREFEREKKKISDNCFNIAAA